MVNNKYLYINKSVSKYIRKQLVFGALSKQPAAFDLYLKLSILKQIIANNFNN